jgi:rubrerythrin
MVQSFDEAEKMANYISCLSMLEHRTALLYKGLSERTDHPLAKSLLFSIAQDSTKHSALLKGIANSISTPDVKSKDCAKRLGESWIRISEYLEELTIKEKAKVALPEMIEKLSTLESDVGEEYYIFVQMQTLQFMHEKISQLYNISLDKMKGIFESIMSDEEHHREVLATLKELLKPPEEKQVFSPAVKYQNPDNWRNYKSNFNDFT